MMVLANGVLESDLMRSLATNTKLSDELALTHVSYAKEIARLVEMRAQERARWDNEAILVHNEMAALINKKDAEYDELQLSLANLQVENNILKDRITEFFQNIQPCFRKD